MGFLPHVQKGDALSARKENAKIDAINAISDRLDTLWLGGGGRGGLRMTILNNSPNAVPTCGALSVTGARISGSFDKFRNVYMSGSVPLSGGALSQTAPLVAYALEGIPAGKIGRVYVPDLYAVIAEEMSSSDQFLRQAATLYRTANNGALRILAKSEADDDDRVFCFAYPVKHEGHRVCTTSGWNGTSKGPDWSANVTIDGAAVSVKCQLLRSGESIVNGTTVIVSWNPDEGKWEVIEAQCPAESGSGSGSGS